MVSVFLSTNSFIHLFLCSPPCCLCVCEFVSLSVVFSYFRPSCRLPNLLFVCPSVVHLPICLSVCLSICLSVCLSVYLSICLSVYLSVCLSVSLSVSVCLMAHSFNYLSVSVCLFFGLFIHSCIQDFCSEMSLRIHFDQIFLHQQNLTAVLTPYKVKFTLACFIFVNGRIDKPHSTADRLS